jgi:phosphoribosylformimino-5-aminoimidazole carboxamide ribotide isomerase
MQLIPAIDLLDGECVRLRHGDFNERTFYEVSALQLAGDYARAGARWLHVVDLAASRDGEDADSRPLFNLLGNADQQVQTGGGVRSEKDIETRLNCGADRIVIGTICATDPQRFVRWLEAFGRDRVVAGLDVRFDEQGIPWPRTHGWTAAGDRSLWDLLDEFSSRGLRHLLCTDIGKDGAMIGPNTALYQDICARYPDLQVQASGGVSGLRDLEQLKTTGAAYAITGKALLEGCFSVEEALGVLA